MTPEDWTHLTAVVGTVCTLGGTLGGVWITQRYQLKMAGERMRHENRTRWHVEKRTLYLEFNEAANNLLLAFQLHPLFTDMAQEKRQEAVQERVRAATRFLDLKDSIAFVAEERVRKATENVFSAWKEASQALAHGTEEFRKEACDAFYKQVQLARDTMREELNPTA